MTTTALKLLALVLMAIDHVGEFIPGMPVWLRWLGRLSAPLFCFCSAWGFHYTRNRKRYLVNLYLWGIGMSVLGYVVTLFVPVGYAVPYNNIFVMLFLSFFIVQIVEDFRDRQTKRALLMMGALLVVQVLSMPLGSIVFGATGNEMLLYLSLAITPSILFCEGGVFFVGMTVSLYFVRNQKKLLCIVYTLFSFLLVLPSLTTLSVQSLLFGNYQWMMIGSLPLMLCYNGQKGRGLKWLFYAFYPAHIFLLYWVGSLLM